MHTRMKGRGVGYTTIDAFYKKGYENMKLSNFKAICDYFKITMDSMARDDVEFPETYNPNAKNIHISKEEEMLVTRYREADNFDKELVLRALRADTKEDAQKMA